MNDLSQTIAPKSDQLNADDLIGGPRTIKVRQVNISKGADQPASIFFEGDDGKPYKPCLSMRRVLVKVWGNDTSLYAGRRMTLYRDDKVRFGGVDVGGIRISHMSGLDAALTMALTDKKGSRKPYTVKPLAEEQGAPRKTKADFLNEARAEARKGSFALDAWRADLNARSRDALDEIAAELATIAEAADAQAGDDDFPGFAPVNEEAL